MTTFPDIRTIFFLTEIPDEPADIPENDPTPFEDQVITAIEEITIELDLPNQNDSN